MSNTLLNTYYTYITMLIIDSIDMRKIHCADLQILKKKKKFTLSRNNDTIGLLSNLARRLSPSAFFSP